MAAKNPRAGALRLRVGHAVERILHVLGHHLPSIVEPDPGAQVEGEGAAVLRDVVALRQTGAKLRRARHVVHQPVVERLDHRPVLPVVADGRVERGDVVLVGYGDVAAGHGVRVERLLRGRGQGQCGDQGGGCEQLLHRFSPVGFYRMRILGSTSGVTRSASRLPSTMATAETSVTPMMMGMSTR